MQLRLNIANFHTDHIVFVPGVTFCVDLTLVGDAVDVDRLLFLSIPSLSDHQFVFFDIKLPTFPATQQTSLS